jgi:molybdopterin converting factor small subunit
MKKKIELELLATLKRYHPEPCDALEIESGITIRQLASRLEIPEYEINLIFINGDKANLDSRLAGGERVQLFPPLGGG